MDHRRGAPDSAGAVRPAAALVNEDIILAGSVVMILSFLTVLGTLLSDLLLVVLDPRIRFEGGSR